MVNAVRCAAHFIEQLAALPAPENTEKREGFLHPLEISGNVTQASCSVIIRDHDAEAFARKKEQLRELAELTAKAFPGSACDIVITDSYLNMRPFIEKAPQVLELVREAYRRAGLTPIEKPIRGGTDGAMLSARGLPCPNVFAGGLNFHSVYEFLPVPNLLKARDVALEIAKISAAA
jgi:tripeptide aminopeptidase